MSDAHKGGTQTAGEQPDRDSGDDGGSPLDRFRDWRENIRQKPGAYRLYKLGVGVLGWAIILGGLAFIPLPGPGWVIVFLGLAILASEYTWAAKLEKYAKDKVSAWTDWVKRQSLVVRGLLGVATGLLVLGLFYVLLLVYGVPGFVPDSWTSWIPGLS